jgi:3-methyladenine DNA glycosylase AlkD
MSSSAPEPRVHLQRRRPEGFGHLYDPRRMAATNTEKKTKQREITFARMFAALKDIADPRRASGAARYFKTGPGEYGEGDVFIGLTVPQTRDLARQFRDAPLAEVDRLLRHKVHEARTLALMILTMQYERGDERVRTAIFRFYCRRLQFVNNWDLVDGSAPTIIGGELSKPAVRLRVKKWSRSRVLWERRVAVLGTFALIRAGDFSLTLELCEALLDDEHDLMHKACGWMLREIGKRDERVLRQWLDRFATTMPRTMLRYSIERFPPTTRKRYLEMRP